MGIGVAFECFCIFLVKFWIPGSGKNSLNLIKYPSGVTELQFGAKFVVRIPREGQRKCSNATPMLVPHFLPYLVKD